MWTKFAEGTEEGEFLDLDDGIRVEVRRTGGLIKNSNHWHRWKVYLVGRRESSLDETFAYSNLKNAKAAAIAFAEAKFAEWAAQLQQEKIAA